MSVPRFRISILFICVLIFILGSCKKYLEAYSQNKSFVQSAADLDELLVGEGYARLYSDPPWYLFLMDDDVEAGLPSGIRSPLLQDGFYSWLPDPRLVEGQFTSASDQDIFFNGIYRNISRLNIILFNVPLIKDKDGSAAALRRISGEAHFLRAFYYYMLVNVYGKPYALNTASADFGIPLKLESPIEDKFFARNSVKQVYDQIEKDLLDAEQKLEGFNVNSRVRANQVAVWALLSRIYLYEEEYEKSVDYAGKLVGNRDYQFVDLARFTPGEDFGSRKSPELVFTMGGPTVPSVVSIDDENPLAEFYQASSELLACYAPEDLRLGIFYNQNSNGMLRPAKKQSFNVNDTYISDAWTIRLPEVYLNMAEALAVMGKSQEAIDVLQELRKNRFKPEHLTAITVSGKALVDLVREERRRELSFEGHRWFDLRRYAVNAKYPFTKTIRHKHVSYGNNGYFYDGYYQLNEYAQDKAAYIVPIARDEIEFNNGVLMNEQRPARQLMH